MVTMMTLKNVQHWHDKRHPPGEMSDCWYCGRQKAKCRSKLFRYTDRDEAFQDAQRMNEADGYANPRTAYYCPWCDQYHHTTKLRRRRDSVVKQKRKWMFKQELERREKLSVRAD